MSRGWTYVSGDWNLLCDVCAKKIKASKSKERWDGFRVCSGCWEPRHSMDFIRARTDKITVPFTRPQQQGIEVNVSYTTIYVNDGYIETTGYTSTYFIDGYFDDPDYYEKVNYFNPLSLPFPPYIESR